MRHTLFCNQRNNRTRNILSFNFESEKTNKIMKLFENMKSIRKIWNKSCEWGENNSNVMLVIWSAVINDCSKNIII